MTIRILVGHVLDRLAEIENGTIHCAVTSPPYWGLRDYELPDVAWPEISYAPIAGMAPCVHVPAMVCTLGLEATVEAFIGHMVLVFREVRRVLRDDGTCWINMGDCYATGAGKVNTSPGGGTQGERWKGIRGDDKGPARGPMTQPNRMPLTGLKPKDMVGQPWRLALALQADGWWLRQDNVWAKPNPMPESVRDRCTKAHEYVFLLAKSERYYFDQDAISEPASLGTHARMAQDIQNQVGSTRANGGDPRPMKAGGRTRVPTGWDQGPGDHRKLAGRYPGNGVGFGHGFDKTPKPRVVDAEVSERMGRGPGWRVKNNASFDAAMAIMPRRRNKRSVWTMTTKGFSEAHFATFPPELPELCIKAGCPGGGLVLDPFFGAGTTGLVADRLGRDCIGIELNEGYAAMARKRIQGEAPLLTEIAV